jgi:hypothetical protein
MDLALFAYQKKLNCQDMEKQGVVLPTQKINLSTAAKILAF